LSLYAMENPRSCRNPGDAVLLDDNSDCFGAKESSETRLSRANSAFTLR
jgi:hypothetical protein